MALVSSLALTWLPCQFVISIRPTSVKDVEQVAKVVFKPTLGAKFTPNMMRGRTLPHPAAEGADLNEVSPPPTHAFPDTKFKKC